MKPTPSSANHSQEHQKAVCTCLQVYARPLPDHPIPKSSSEALSWVQSAGRQAWSLTGFLTTLPLPSSVILRLCPKTWALLPQH